MDDVDSPDCVSATRVTWMTDKMVYRRAEHLGHGIQQRCNIIGIVHDPGSTRYDDISSDAGSPFQCGTLMAFLSTPRPLPSLTQGFGYELAQLPREDGLLEL